MPTVLVARSLVGPPPHPALARKQAAEHQPTPPSPPAKRRASSPYTDNQICHSKTPPTEGPARKRACSARDANPRLGLTLGRSAAASVMGRHIACIFRSAHGAISATPSRLHPGTSLHPRLDPCAQHSTPSAPVLQGMRSHRTRSPRLTRLGLMLTPTGILVVPSGP